MKAVYIIGFFLGSLVIHTQAMDDMMVQSNTHKTIQYSNRAIELLRSLDGGDVDLSNKFGQRQEEMLKRKKNQKDLYSLAADFCSDNKNITLAKQLYAKASLLGNVESLVDLSKLFPDEATKELLMQEAAKNNSYRAKVYLGETREVY